MFYLSNHKGSTTAGAKVIKNWIALDPPTFIVILIRFLYAPPSYFSLKQSPPCKLTLPAVGKENSNFLISRLLFSMSQAYQPVTLHSFISIVPDIDSLPEYYWHTQQTRTTFIFLVCLSKHINKRKFPSAEIIWKMVENAVLLSRKKPSLDLNWK